MDKLYIVIPAYNEEKNIEFVVRAWYDAIKKETDEFKIVIADSGSTDNTHSILLDLKDEYKNIEIISNTQKEHGAKLIALYKYAIKNDATYIFQTDSDGQTNPAEFKGFWALRNEYDAIIGKRLTRGDGAMRKFVENVVCVLLGIIFGISVVDANAPFRLMRRDLLSKYINRFKDDYALPNVMLTTFFKYYKENVIFKEISFRPRQAGKNFINIQKIISIGIDSLADFKEFRRKM